MDLASNSCSLEGADVHGFHSLGDLRNFLGEASSRWLRPNEVLAVLCNYKYFKIQPQPVDKPESGHVLLFDRKMLRNFRQDGHRWKRKKDGKSIQEAHEKLKIGNEERIHVYYARGEHEPSFYRRSYWLLDKNKDRIVLVHYRRISEEKREHLSTPMESKEVSPSTKKMQYDSPTTPVNSTSGSAHSELSGSAALSEEINSGGQTAHIGSDSSLVCGGTGLRNNEFGLDDIETLEWSDELGDIVQACISTDSGCVPPAQQMQYDLRNNYLNDAAFLPPKETASYWRPSEVVDRTGCSDAKLNGGYSHIVESQQNPQLGFSDVKQMSDGFSQVVEDEQNPVPLFNAQVMDCISNQSRNEISQIYTDGVFSSQSSFGRWNYVNDDSLGSLHGQQFGAPSQNGDFTHKEIFTIVDISPTWAYCTEATKVILIGSFDESNKHLAGSNMYCIIGKKCVAAEMVLNGVYRCTVMGQNLGMVNLFLTLDGNTPISQVLSFEYRSVPGTCAVTKPLEEDTVELSKMTSQVQRRLAHLLFSTTNTISILSNTRHLSTLRKAQKFADLTSPLMDKEWRNLLDISGNDDGSHVPRSEDLFELLLKNKLQEWLLNRVVEGCTITARDFLGQGAIHLCAILDYAWAVHLFLSSGLSLDFRDAYGWTALHWAAYYGREKMVAALLTSGANASLVTDSTAENPGGCTAADVASIRGYEGLAAYLAEEGLAAHMKAMALSGNIKSPLLPTSNDAVNYENLSEQELCLKDSLAAYRNAADAAARIQDAFRERALKLQTRAVQMVKPEMEATQIVSALKIQTAYRKYNARKMLKAAARIQSHFRTWQARKNFLNMRRQAIRIQAVYRGRQARRQYRKVIWSVGVLEKAILRWRLKKKGLRGIKTEETEAMRVDMEQEDNVMEQDFFRIGREQAEDRMQRSVVKVQAIFRSYRAQQEYRRIKLAHQHAKLEFDLGGAFGFS